MPARAWALAMGEVLGFPGSTARKAQRKKKREGGTLCRQGFHAWEVDKDRAFDSKQGRLVTRRRCRRCGAEETTLT
jgi:hypothetical protein